MKKWLTKTKPDCWDNGRFKSVEVGINLNIYKLVWDLLWHFISHGFASERAPVSPLMTSSEFKEQSFPSKLSAVSTKRVVRIVPMI